MAIRKLKSSTQVFDQRTQVFELLKKVTRQHLNRVDPRTEGKLILAGNWGNKQAQQVLDQFEFRCARLHQVATTLENQAFKREYPNHLNSQQA